MAARTRSFASRTAVSGSPTIESPVRADRPTRASTLISQASTPTRATDVTDAYMARPYGVGVTRNGMRHTACGSRARQEAARQEASGRRREARRKQRARSVFRRPSSRAGRRKLDGRQSTVTREQAPGGARSPFSESRRRLPAAIPGAEGLQSRCRRNPTERPNRSSTPIARPAPHDDAGAR